MRRERLCPGFAAGGLSNPSSGCSGRSRLDLERFRQLAAAGYRYIPVYSEQPNDMETPVTIFYKLTEGKGRFLLESLEQDHQRSRYSFIGWNPLLTLKASGDEMTFFEKGRINEGRGDPLTELKKKLDTFQVAPLPELGPFYGGAVGYIGYDYVRLLQKLPVETQPLTNLPDLHWVIPRYLARIDHRTHKITLIVLAAVNPDDIDGSYEKAVRELVMINNRLDRSLPMAPLPNAVPIKDPVSRLTTISRHEFMDLVARVKKHIQSGEVQQVVLSQRIIQEYTGDPFCFYRVLRLLNPSPYLFYLDFGDHQLAGSSPETMVRLEDGLVTLKPIAGTRRRGSSTAEDERLRRELLADEKEQAEHLMLVELGRNELSQVCRFGSIRITELMAVEFYSHVMHLVSTLQGELRPAYSGADLIRAVFPAGTLSGAPKQRALELIERLEPTRREFYGGCVGYLGFNGNLDTCITIRTVLFHGRQAHLQVGAGIVAASEPAKEYEETLNKAAALIVALDQAQGRAIS
ncbi:anthranilate synthase component I family protein [Capillibacterium thermochitinicola]|uniref:Anthranilate synthase component 1 n=1 Tax=Capillibacterium thermochitinicola TaxID=2699427 RepID=A0A8J6I066_9FIRM|nr:chorismate-binding protein [Capillibacterium thermochitinicola]MBA2132533.1 chorismate-binding protein [Capillibacterium thermochitinicola]